MLVLALRPDPAGLPSSDVHLVGPPGGSGPRPESGRRRPLRPGVTSTVARPGSTGPEVEDVRTVELGQFTDEHAEDRGARSRTPESSGRSSPGPLRAAAVRGDWGARPSSTSPRLEDAREVAATVADG